MLIHNFKYSLKTLFRNKMLIFWTFAFPIILGTFFNMAFSNIENSEKLDIIHIAIIDNEEFNNSRIWKETFKTLSDENAKDRLFDTKYVTQEEAKQLLENSEIIGYMVLEEKTPKLVLETSGIEQTVFKQVVEEIIQTSEMVSNLTQAKVEDTMMLGNAPIDIEQISKDILDSIQKEKVKIKDISRSNLSYTMIEYYTLIAMTCLYGGILGMVAMNQNLANMSTQGKRISVAPTRKGTVVLSSMLAGYLTQLVGLTLLFMYTVFVLKVDYGTNLPFIILLGAVGSFAGLALGVLIGTVVKAGESLKTGMMISITMLGCFLSGMMGITMKYIVDKNIPLLNKINPASMITDGFYALYYYDTLERFFFDMISLVIFSVLAMLISYLCLRRQKYDSI